MKDLHNKKAYPANEKQIILCEELQDGIVSYELFAEKNDNDTMVYGIMITSDLPYDSNSVFVRDITDSEALARELFDRLIAYVVTPCELEYAVEDFIFEKYCM